MRVNEPTGPRIYVFTVSDGTRQGLQFIEANSQQQAEHRIRSEIVQFIGTLEDFVEGMTTDQFDRNVFLKPNSDREVGWQWWQ